MRQQEVKGGDNDKEEEEVNGVEQHENANYSNLDELHGFRKDYMEEKVSLSFTVSDTWLH